MKTHWMFLAGECHDGIGNFTIIKNKLYSTFYFAKHTLCRVLYWALCVDHLASSSRYHCFPIVQWGFISCKVDFRLILYRLSRVYLTRTFGLHCSAGLSFLCFFIFIYLFFMYFLKRFYLFLERGEGREKERNNSVWLPPVCPLLGTWPTTQACALTGNWTSDPLVCRPTLNPLSHTRWGVLCFFKGSM